MIEVIRDIEKRADYLDLHQNSSDSMIYQSPPYLAFLRSALGGGVSAVGEFDSSGKLLGAIPFVLLEVDGVGKVLNSLPWFGSHGAAIIRTGQNKSEIIRRLLGSFSEFLSKSEVDFATVVTSPDTSLEMGEALNELKYGFVEDRRVGQWTRIGGILGEGELLDRFHSKTRNVIRKALKENFEFHVDNGDSARQFLVDTHFENMYAIGGRPKPREHFESLFKELPPSAFEIWTATIRDEYAAAILLLKHGKVIEYFIPALKKEFRESQCLSGLIYSAMLSFSHSGFDQWNWGGTWKTQESLYRFKSRWGAVDRSYSYFSFAKDEDASKIKVTKFLENFPYFFIFPNEQIK